MNFLDAEITPDASPVKLTDKISLPIETDGISNYAGRPVTLGIRAEHFERAEENNGFSMAVNHIEILGVDTLMYG